MKDHNKSNLENSIDMTFEGNEDLLVRPWTGPSPQIIGAALGLVFVTK